MSVKENILYSLNQSRGLVNGLIESMSSESDWMHQVHPKANHPLWILGHIGLADNMFLTRLNSEAGNKPEGWDDMFWFGSDISSDRSKYPPTEEVISYFRERREKLIAKISELDDEFLASPTPDEGMFADAPNMAQMLMFISFHEGVHAGQFTIAHRGLGNAPMFQPSPAAAATE